MMHKSNKSSIRVSSDENSDEFSTTPPILLTSEILDRNRKLLANKKRHCNTQNDVNCQSSSEGTPVFKKSLNPQLKNHITKYYTREISTDESALSSDSDKVPRDEITDRKEHIVEVLSPPKTPSSRRESIHSTDNNDCMSDNIEFHSSTKEPTQEFNNNTSNDSYQSEQQASVNQSEENLSRKSIRNRKRKKTPQIKKILAEIQRQQSMVNLVIPRLSFLRVVRNVMEKYPSFGIHSGAVAALHECSELMLIDFFEDVDRYASHRNRVTIGVEDLQLAMHTLRKYDKSFA